MIKAGGGTKKFELFSHDADMGVRGYGATVKEAFEQAACALSSIACDLDKVNPEQKVEIECDSPNLTILFVDWLNSLIYEADRRKWIFSKFEIHHMDEKTLKANVWGEAINVHKHHPAVEVKGATFTQVRVAQLPDGLWVAQTVVDV